MSADMRFLCTNRFACALPPWITFSAVLAKMSSAARRTGRGIADGCWLVVGILRITDEHGQWISYRLHGVQQMVYTSFLPNSIHSPTSTKRNIDGCNPISLYQFSKVLRRALELARWYQVSSSAPARYKHAINRRPDHRHWRSSKLIWQS